MGWSETHALWRVPKWKINVYMHCHLFAEGAKVLTRKASEQRMAELSAAIRILCQKASK